MIILKTTSKSTVDRKYFYAISVFLIMLYLMLYHSILADIKFSVNVSFPLWFVAQFWNCSTFLFISKSSCNIVSAINLWMFFFFFFINMTSYFYKFHASEDKWLYFNLSIASSLPMMFVNFWFVGSVTTFFTFTELILII